MFPFFKKKKKKLTLISKRSILPLLYIRYFEGQFAPITEVEISDEDVQAHVRVTEAAEKVA